VKNIVAMMFISTFLFGCASSSFKTIQTVNENENIFYSSRNPSCKVQVNKEFTYLGMLKKKYATTNGTDYYTNMYMFAKADDNSKITSGLGIKLYRLSNGYWNSDIFKNEKNRLISNTTKINGKFYNQTVFVSNLGNSNFFADKGLIRPSKGIMWVAAKNIGVNSDKRFYVYYYEDLDNFNKSIYPDSSYVNWDNPDNLSDVQRSAIASFIDRANDAFTISEYTSDPTISIHPTATLADSNSVSNARQLTVFKSETNSSMFLIDTRKWKLNPDLIDKDNGVEFFFQRKGKEADLVGMIITNEMEYISGDSSDSMPGGYLVKYFVNQKNFTIIHHEVRNIHGLKISYIKADQVTNGMKVRWLANISADSAGGTMIAIITSKKVANRYREDIDEFLDGLYLQPSKGQKVTNTAKAIKRDPISGGLQPATRLDKPTTAALAYQNKNYDKAYSGWKSLAENGSAEAAFRLAGMYVSSEGVSQDFTQSTKWLLKASECGHGDAQCKLANRYETGLGTEKDNIQAYYWRWLCVHNDKASRRVKAQAKTSMKGDLSKLNQDEIKWAENQAKHWIAYPNCK